MRRKLVSFSPIAFRLRKHGLSFTMDLSYANRIGAKGEKYCCKK